jgi:hypothetical protein
MRYAGDLNALRFGRDTALLCPARVLSDPTPTRPVQVPGRESWQRYGQLPMFSSEREIMQMANMGNAAPGTAVLCPYEDTARGWPGATVAAMAPVGQVALHPDLQAWAHSGRFVAQAVLSAGRSDRPEAERGAA